MDSVFFPDGTFPDVRLGAGDYSRRLLAHGGSLMLAQMDFEAGAVSAAHSHPEEQLSYCLEGEFEADVAGQTRRLAAGDSFYAGPGVRHGVRCLRSGRILHVFTPQREDYK